MGIYLALTTPDGSTWVPRETVHAYCDFVAKKERAYHPETPEEELMANRNRKKWLRHIKEDSKGALISHRLYTGMTEGVDLRISEDNPHSVIGDDPIFGEDIEVALERFREGKERLNERDDDTNWEETLELQHIALCEFALEHDHGIVYS